MSKHEVVARYLEMFDRTPVSLFKKHYALRMGVHLSLLPPEAEAISDEEFDLILSQARAIACSCV